VGKNGCEKKLEEIIMTGNDFVAFFLRTPLHIFLGNIMLITVTGCKTGKKYSTPVGFYRENDSLWILTSRDRTWWRNVTNGSKVSLLLKGKLVDAFAQAELDEKDVEARMLDYIRQVPMAAKPLGIRMENRSPNWEDVARVAKTKLFVKVRPDR
jgi:deazaflavin-dependent oxidoreductase (nitroreductase family)